MARKTKEDSEKTLQALLDSAAELFRKQGVANTTLNDIARSAGLSRGAVYWRFENKDQLIKALWERSAGAASKKYLDALNSLPEQHAYEHTLTHIQGFICEALTDPKLNQYLHIISSSMEFTLEQTELQLYLQAQRQLFYDTIRAAISKLQDLGELSKQETDEFITNGLWVVLTGIVRTSVEMEALEIHRYTSKFIETWLNNFRADNLST